MMGGLKVYIPDELERRFREAAMRLFGYGRGSLSIAAERAFELWLSRVSEVLELAESIEGPLEAVHGMLSHVKKTGVELQHEAGRARTRRTLEYRGTA